MDSVKIKDNRKLTLLCVAFLLFGFEIYRIANYSITWDEALTYRHFVLPIFRGEGGG